MNFAFLGNTFCRSRNGPEGQECVPPFVQTVIESRKSEDMVVDRKSSKKTFFTQESPPQWFTPELHFLVIFLG